MKSRHGHSARRLSASRIRLDVGSSYHFIIKDDNYIVESQTNQHKLLTHLRSEVFTLSMPLKDIAEQLEDGFILCRRGCLINTLHVDTLNWKARKIIFDDRENAPVLIERFDLWRKKRFLEFTEKFN